MKTIVNNQTINSLWAFLLHYDEYLSSGTSNINNCSTTSSGPVISAGFGKHYYHKILVLSNAVYSTCYYLVAICSIAGRKSQLFKLHKKYQPQFFCYAHLFLTELRFSPKHTSFSVCTWFIYPIL